MIDGYYLDWTAVTSVQLLVITAVNTVPVFSNITELQLRQYRLLVTLPSIFSNVPLTNSQHIPKTEANPLEDSDTCMHYLSYTIKTQHFAHRTCFFFGGGVWFWE